MTDSIDTMTIPSPTATTAYPTHVTDKVAPREGKDLFLRIDVGDRAAWVHCKQEERVGDHEHRKVIFKADKACTLYFDHSEVFGTSVIDVSDKPTPMDVVVPLGKTSWTLCEVLPKGAGKVLPTRHASPPIIIVP
jgi:hypothetical protein